MIHMLAAVGTDREIIARAVGISRTTMLKYYRAVLNDAKTLAIGRMAVALYRKGLRGNVTAQIFYLKCQGGWQSATDGSGAIDPRVPDVQLVVQAMPGGEPDSDSEPPE